MELTRWFYDAQENVVLDVNRFVSCAPRYPEDGPLLAIAPEAVEALVGFVEKWDAGVSASVRLKSAEELVRSVRSIVEQPWKSIHDPD